MKLTTSIPDDRRVVNREFGHLAPIMADILSRFGPSPTLAGVRQDLAAIEAGKADRRLERARRLAGDEVHKCIAGVLGLGRPLTASLGQGLADIAIETYLDVMAGKDGQ